MADLQQVRGRFPRAAFKQSVQKCQLQHEVNGDTVSKVDAHWDKFTRSTFTVKEPPNNHTLFDASAGLLGMVRKRPFYKTGLACSSLSLLEQEAAHDMGEMVRSEMWSRCLTKERDRKTL
jgi:hypothetical protein